MSIINSVIKGKQPVIDTLNVTPTTSAQQITAPQGTDGYSPVNVSAVTSSIDANIVAGNIKKDVQILGVTGSYEGTTPTGTKSITSNGVYDVTNYASADVNVPTTAPSRYLEYSTDVNGKLIHDPTVSSIISLNGVTDIGDYVLAYAYQNNTSLTGAVDLSSLTKLSGSNACQSAFNGCTGITSVDLSSLRTISNNGSCSYMFNGCTGLISVDLGLLTTISSSGSCSYMFQNCTSLTSIDLGSLTTIEGITGASYMFKGCINLTGLIDLSLLKKINSSPSMFSDCVGITGVDLSSLSIFTSASTCAYMFYNCTSLISANLSSVFIANTNNNFQGTFQNCRSLTNIDLSSLTVISGSSACSSMFQGCTSLATFSFSRLCKLGTSNCVQTMFKDSSLTSLSFPALAYTATNFNGAFSNMLQGVTGCTVHFPAEWQTDMASWSNVTAGFGGTNTTVLFDLPNVTTLDLSGITEIINNNLFSNFASNNYFPNITSVDLSSLAVVYGSASCQNMFNGCTSINSVNLSSLARIYGNNCCSNMFANCTSLTSLSFPALNTVLNANMIGGMLNGVTGCTVHFPSNLSSYSFENYIGGTNTTVLYDLHATNILTGANTVKYERNPKYDTTTALAWRVKDGGTNDAPIIDWTPYYTSGLTDPTVGTTIYSDSACTIAETTVDSVI